MATKPQMLAAYYRKQITTGMLAIGEELPTIDQLCAHWDMSMMTVREGLRMLVDEGLIETAQGQRTRVVRKPSDIARTVQDLKDGMETLREAFLILERHLKATGAL